MAKEVSKEMINEILKCTNCHTYTLKQMCPKCNNKCISPKPAKFSPEDKYGEWRRKAKREQENG